MPHRALSEDEFESVVADALDSLPERFAHLIDNVAVTVEEEPSSDDRARIEPSPGEQMELLGVYRGVARTDRGVAPPLCQTGSSSSADRSTGSPAPETTRSRRFAAR